MVCAPAGTETLAPTASILPSRITTVPFSMSGPLTVTMRALRIANVPRGGSTPCCVVGLPICWAKAELVKISNASKVLKRERRTWPAFAPLRSLRLCVKYSLRLLDLRVIFMTARAAAGSLRGLTACRRLVWLSLLECRALLREHRTLREVFFAIEINVAVDEGRIDTRVDTERMPVPDREIRILANFDRAHALLNTEL